ncbi:TetR/AcrR family transcriptional regulator [Pontibacterium granulatum]|uniref:TetR/AcrR family transcriptional regulator n=1 Tax=Pontibacterium granulatum TaxID=2036029 RepID=UPI00249B08E9|nr:TetR/AcrR family transcriptional regulator [Pontibacterium granulatum]MDI3324791.1 TetR/AcrR family transcriptional regulator [Pontibacterium granulatum]
MANKLKHDRQLVINQATNLFWEKGFHATSMRNLQDHIDMRPGSIYAAFGSKEGLFKETLQCYADGSLKRLQASVEATPSPLAAMKHFVKLVVQQGKNQAPNEMCMLVKTVSELTEENEELLEESKRLLKVMENAFADLLSQAQQAGEIDSSKDPQRLARLIQMQLIGLRLYARTSNSENSVNDLIDDLFNCLK